MIRTFPSRKIRAWGDMDIGTAAYLYALRATPSAARQTADLVSVSPVRTPDCTNVFVCKTPSRFIVRIHEIIPL